MMIDSKKCFRVQIRGKCDICEKKFEFEIPILKVQFALTKLVSESKMDASTIARLLGSSDIDDNSEGRLHITTLPFTPKSLLEKNGLHIDSLIDRDLLLCQKCRKEYESAKGGDEDGRQAT